LPKSVASFCSCVLEILGAAPCVLSVAFVDRARMLAMNRQYLARDYATDVLSFSYQGESQEGVPLLGEIVIAPAVALEHARRYSTSCDREIRKLLVHGILHLLGFDHTTDGGAMNGLQRRVLRRRAIARAVPLVEMEAGR